MRVYAVLAGLVTFTCVASLFIGPGDLSKAHLQSTFLSLRAVRLCAAFLAGSALAVGGVVVQGMFKNPLASPSILGTTAGADLGGKLSLLLFDLVFGSTAGAASVVMEARWFHAEMLLPLGCVVGALGALLLLLAIRRATDDMIVLLLTGFLLTSLFGSLGGFLTSIASERPELARAMIAFGLGDVSGVGLRRVLLGVPLVVCGIVAAFLWSRSLDVMLAGAEEAEALGVEVDQVRMSCVVWIAVLTAAAVAVGGSVAFVGLIVPHALRPLVGVQHRRLVPAAAMLGGTFLVACDMLARTAPLGSEIPLGVVTGVIGAPLFLFLLLRSREELGHA